MKILFVFLALLIDFHTPASAGDWIVKGDVIVTEGLNDGGGQAWLGFDCGEELMFLQTSSLHLYSSAAVQINWATILPNGTPTREISNVIARPRYDAPDLLSWWSPDLMSAMKTNPSGHNVMLGTVRGVAVFSTDGFTYALTRCGYRQ